MDRFDTPEPAISPQPFSLGQRPFLDGIRGVAILMVLLVHFFPKILPGGYFGVDLFFVLSGFLITALLMQEREKNGTIRLGRFCFNRLARLLPPMAIMLAVSWMAMLTIGKADRAAVGETLSALTFSYNWCYCFDPSSIYAQQFIHLWSLAVEFQFYLVWATAFALGSGRSRSNRGPIAFLFISIGAAALIRAETWEGPQSLGHLYFATHMRMDAFAYGCLAGMIIVTNRDPRTIVNESLLRITAWISAAFLLGFALFVDQPTHFGNLAYRGYRIFGPAFPAACAALLLTILFSAPPRALRWILESRPLIGMGRVSYGIYLWHVPIIFILIAGFDWEVELPTFLAATAISILAGWLSRRWIDQPVMRWRRSRIQPHHQNRISNTVSEPTRQAA